MTAEAVFEARESGVPLSWLAETIGRMRMTLRRWCDRIERGTPLIRRPGPAPYCRWSKPGAAQRATILVRETKGLVGAESICHTIPELSRREAAWIKHQARTEMERERKIALSKLKVHVPGVMRSFDGLELRVQGQKKHCIVTSDAALPYRTMIRCVSKYDSVAVALMLAADYEENGAPLVQRLDRAKMHQTAEVRAVLDAHSVLMLHGPPHFPQYYGQHERQNREHRAWLWDLPPEVDDDALSDLMLKMKRALNGSWRRATLGWCTAEELWLARPALNIDRRALRDDVQSRASSLRLKLTQDNTRSVEELAWRLAIQQSLADLGFLTLTKGGWC